ncbi:hypothetical protein ACFL7M_17730 [Thermodesulfobacteriota bacterium]
MDNARKTGKNPETGKRQGGTSKKHLKTSAIVKEHQKEWFKSLRERISNGEPFGLCDADQAEEIFLAMGIPVIIKQWWSGLIAAKRLSPRYFDLLEQKGYDLCRYCSLGFGCTMDNNPDLAPWGGAADPHCYHRSHQL